MTKDFQQCVKHQVNLLKAGQILEAFDRFFATDVTMYENDKLFGQGAESCRGKQEPYISAATTIVGIIPDVTVSPDHLVCAFRNRSRFTDSNGEEHQIDGLHWQAWNNGQVVEERYYRDAMMDRKVADGVLEFPELLLRSVPIEAQAD